MSERQLPPVVEEMLAWRRRNGLSQEAAVRVMQAYGYPVTVGTLQKWEKGLRKPSPMTGIALAGFLQKYPVVKLDKLNRPLPPP